MSAILVQLRDAAAVVAALLATAPLAAQQPAPDARLAAERRDFAAWLVTHPLSPAAAVAHQPIGGGLALGPADADLPLAGLARHAVRTAGRTVQLEDGAGAARPLPAGTPVPLGPYRLLVRGAAGRQVLTVYGAVATGTRPPAWFAEAPAERLLVTLRPPAQRTPVTLLGPDGIETSAVEAGFALLPSGDSLRVRWLQLDGDEAELVTFFRDATNGRTTYPAGRFVTLEPAPGGRWRLDFNRARNPSCAYRTVFPCPAPWPGAVLARAVTAGERYESH